MTYSREDDHAVVGATPARQGRWGRPVFWVLVVSTLLATLGLFAAWVWKAPALDATEPTKAEAQQSAQTFDVPAPPPASSTNP